MKKVKVSNRIDLAVMGYRLGKINVGKVTGQPVNYADLQYADDFAQRLHWGITAPGCYWDICTDMRTGAITYSNRETD